MVGVLSGCLGMGVCVALLMWLFRCGRYSGLGLVCFVCLLVVLDICCGCAFVSCVIVYYCLGWLGSLLMSGLVQVSLVLSGVGCLVGFLL